MSPPSSAGTGIVHDEHPLQFGTPYKPHTLNHGASYTKDIHAISYKSGLPSVLRTNSLLILQSLIIANG